MTLGFRIKKIFQQFDFQVFIKLLILQYYSPTAFLKNKFSENHVSLSASKILIK
jgi:hypothetical protein